MQVSAQPQPTDTTGGTTTPPPATTTTTPSSTPATTAPKSVASSPGGGSVPVFEESGREILITTYGPENIQIHVLDNFENAHEWISLTPSDFGYSKAKGVKKLASQIQTSGEITLGLKEWSYSRGFNWTEITPPTPIKIPGNCKALAIWANGRNFRHNLEAWVRNYEGKEYFVNLGSLNFSGWKLIAAKIPGNIKQYSKYVPQYKPLYFIKFVVRHHPDERTGTFYLYLDDFQAACDMFREPLDNLMIDQESQMEYFDKQAYFEEDVQGP